MECPASGAELSEQGWFECDPFGCCHSARALETRMGAEGLEQGLSLDRGVGAVVSLY